MKKTLVIGWREGNLADAFLTLAGWEGDHHREFVTPSQTDMDMLAPVSIERYLEEHGPFDEIVYCAAVNELTWIRDIARTDLERAYGVNVFGLVEVVARHREWFGERPLKVVAIVSDASRVAMRGSLLYGSSKTALVGVLKNMARELAPSTIVVGVSPGVIEGTPMTDYIDKAVPIFRGWSPEQAAQYETSAIPLGRRTTKREVAQVMLFALDGPDALTGSIIEITGGK
jgi:NAD(P)-dependent dehydrogenase (short-subunit alcohol dehydrogenase family)